MMDPDATLREMRELVGTFNEDPECFDPHRLVELVEALDEWLVGGGFLPSAWRIR